MLWMLLLACWRGDVADLRQELDALADDLEDVEDDVKDLEDADGEDTGAGDTADTGEPLDTEDSARGETADTAPTDTDEPPPPEPGDIAIDARWDSNTRIWAVTVELSEDGEGVAVGSHLNIDNHQVSLRGRCTAFTIDEGWTASTSFTVEVAWASGAESCGQLLAEGQPAATGCEVLFTRPTGC